MIVDDNNSAASTDAQIIRIDDREYDDVDHATREETLDLNDLIDFSSDQSITNGSIAAKSNDIQMADNFQDVFDFAGSIVPTVSDDFEFSNDVSMESISLPISFEIDTRLSNKFGPSPCLILTALTMTNASDGVNLGKFISLRCTVGLMRRYALI